MRKFRLFRCLKAFSNIGLNGVYSSVVAKDVTRQTELCVCDDTSSCGFAVLAVLG